MASIEAPAVGHGEASGVARKEKGVYIRAI